MDEAGWIEASKRGEVQAFNHLVLAHQQMAYTLAFRMLRDEEAASDATQEAFILAFTRLHQFRGGSFKAWLARIVLNQVYDQLRVQRRHPTESLDPLPEREDAPALQIPDGEPSPEQAVLSSELLACIESGFETLSPEQRATVILSDVQGMSYDEIAIATNASLGTVKSRLSRGRLAMRNYLSQHSELLPASYRHYYTGQFVGDRGLPTVVADG